MCDEEGEESGHDVHTCSGTCSVWEGGGGSMAEGCTHQSCVTSSLYREALACTHTCAHIHVHTYMMYVLLRYMYIRMHTQHIHTCMQMC